MNYEKKTGSFVSSNQESTITYYVYQPVGEIKALMQISHGMCEYVERYEDMIEFLTGNGILVFGNDHLGHKGSVSSKEDLGFFASKDGWMNLPKDVAHLADIIRGEYPDKKLFLFGHSMGSFVARTTIAWFSEKYDGAIISGTAGSSPMLKMGQTAIRLVRKFKGERYKSTLLDNLMFGSYNKRIKHGRTDKDWLTRDEKIVDKYLNDEYCMFLFTTAAMYDLTELLGYVNSKEWYEKVPADFPIFLISGDADPVGGWGKGILEIDGKLKKTKRKDYRMKLYHEFRHEIANELGKEEVYEDVKQWITDRI